MQHGSSSTLRTASPRTRSIALSLLGLGLLAVTACNRQSNAAAEKKIDLSIPVTLEPVAVRPVQRTVEIVGTLYGDEEATISSKAAGKIIRIHKDMGDRAASGEPLALVEQTDYELARDQKSLAVKEILAKLGLREMPPSEFNADKLPTVERARLQAANAKAKRDRGKQLHDQKPPLISDQDYADIDTAYEVAQSNYDVEVLTAGSNLSQARTRLAELAMANEKLADTVIRAPEISGVSSTQANTVERDFSKNRVYAIADRLVSLGEFVREGTPTFRLVKDDPIKLRAAVPERYVATVRVGQQVKLYVEAYAEAFEGTLARINPAIEPATRTFQVEVAVPNPRRLLRPGGFARAYVETHLEPQVVFAPLESVLSFAGVNKVYTVEDSKAVELPIQVGSRQEGMIEVTQGLKPGTKVVVRGVSKLAPGIPVTLQSPTTAPTS